ncbi:MAG: cob(I)yrinic acid a,c-diamide adenosyltransferase [Pseudomonadota bacterium]
MGLERGYIHVYTGNGKGKTTAAFGLALRAAGQGLKVVIIQFLKGKSDTGEVKAASCLSPRLSIHTTGDPGFVPNGQPGEHDGILARNAFDLARRIAMEGSTDLLILDEINVAVAHGLVAEECVLSLMEEKPPLLELVLTGRNATPGVIERADLVTEMREVKHYFKRGVMARHGIEK